MFLSKTMFFPSKFYVVSKQKSRLSVCVRVCVCVCVRVCVCLTNKPTQQDEMYCIIQRKCWVEPRQGRNMSIGCNFCISSIVVIDACSWCTNLAHDLGMLGYVGCTNMAHPGNLVCAIYSAVPIFCSSFSVQTLFFCQLNSFGFSSLICVVFCSSSFFFPSTLRVPRSCIVHRQSPGA